MVKEGRKRESDGEGEEVSLLTSFLCLTDCVVSESKKLYSSEFVFCEREKKRERDKNGILLHKFRIFRFSN